MFKYCGERGWLLPLQSTVPQLHTFLAFASSFLAVASSFLAVASASFLAFALSALADAGVGFAAGVGLGFATVAGLGNGLRAGTGLGPGLGEPLLLLLLRPGTRVGFLPGTRDGLPGTRGGPRPGTRLGGAPRPAGRAGRGARVGVDFAAVEREAGHEDSELLSTKAHTKRKRHTSSVGRALGAVGDSHTALQRGQAQRSVTILDVVTCTASTS